MHCFFLTGCAVSGAQSIHRGDLSKQDALFWTRCKDAGRPDRSFFRCIHFYFYFVSAPHPLRCTLGRGILGFYRRRCNYTRTPLQLNVRTLRTVIILMGHPQNVLKWILRLKRARCKLLGCAAFFLDAPPGHFDILQPTLKNLGDT